MARSALRDFAVWVSGLSDSGGPGGNQQQARLSWVIQKALVALAEDVRELPNTHTYRQGILSIPGERPRFVYVTGASPAANDEYLFDAGDRPTAELVVTALNALPPPGP